MMAFVRVWLALIASGLLAAGCESGNSTKPTKGDPKATAGPGQRSSKLFVPYYLTVDEVTKTPERFLGRTIRLNGIVGAGSIQVNRKSGVTIWELISKRSKQRITTRYTGSLPDAFDADGGGEIIATGTLARDGGKLVFESTAVLAKCPSKYDSVKKR